MEFLKRICADEIASAAATLFPAATLTAGEVVEMLDYPPDANMGDLALPCFKLAKALRTSPVVIAQKLAEAITSKHFSRIEAVNGYLNFFVDGVALTAQVVGDVAAAGDQYGSPMDGGGRTVVLDYSSPTVAKPFHVGHLGTTVIGHSLKLLYQFAGWKTVGINYLGDWGTQFGKLILAYRKWGSREEVEAGGIDSLVALYVKINNAIDDSDEGRALADAARAEFRKMEDGDPENIELWKWFIEISLAEYEKTYRQLNMTFDSYKGESFYTDKMPAQVQKLRDMGLLKIDDGASIVDLEPYGMPPCLILKRDGSTLYPTRDIAAAVYRKEHYGFDRAIYVTSAQQTLHFKQWFQVVKMMGYPWADELVHIPYGTVSINGAKLATRTGNVVLLRDVFAQAIEKVSAIMVEKNPALAGRDDIAEQVGVGAIVFHYLSNSRIRDINFIMEDALSFDGNTGPYAQYTYARTCSVMRKYEGTSVWRATVVTPEEVALAKTISRFGERVKAALDEHEPSNITRYILDLCAAFNRFYHECPILSCEDEAIRESRVALTSATRTVLGTALHLICMAAPEQI